MKTDFVNMYGVDAPTSPVYQNYLGRPSFIYRTPDGSIFRMKSRLELGVFGIITEMLSALEVATLPEHLLTRLGVLPFAGTPTD